MNYLRHVVFLLCLLAFATDIAAQTPDWLWVKIGGITGEDYVSSITVDNAGNIYATGSFSYSLAFPGIALQGTYKDMFVLKMDPEGNIVWMAKANGPGDKVGQDIAVDVGGNVYVTGYFQGTATFDGTTLTSVSDLFVGKLDPNGSWLWASQASATSSGIDVEADGEVYLTGSFYESCTFGGISVTGSGSDIYVAKLFSNGTWAWVHTAGGQLGTVGETGNKIAVNSLGNGAIAGKVFEGATFGGITVNETGAFVAFFDEDGWTHVNTTESAEATDIVLGGYLGEVYVCGFFWGTSSFGGTHPQVSSGDWEAFVACVSSTGSWNWSARAGGVYADKSHGITLDSFGNIYVTGDYGSNATFGSIPVPGVENNMFAAKLNALGEWQWIQHAGGYAGAWSKTIAVDGAGYCYAGGSLMGTVAFGDIVVTYSGWSDVFISKLGSGTAVADALVHPLPSSLSSPWPNPIHAGDPASITAKVANGELAILTFCNLRGQLVSERHLSPGEQQISLETRGLPAGIYLCKLRTQTAASIRKLVIVK